MKNWKIPTVILILLIVVMIFRWSTLSSQTVSSSPTTSSSVVKFERDNWNGAIYQQIYYTRRDYKVQLVNPPFMWIWSNNLTYAWVALTGGTVLWLLLSLRTQKKDSSNKEEEGIPTNK